MKISLILILICSTVNVTYAQTKKSSSKNSGKQQQLVVGINIPFGRFAETHIGGFSAGYEWSDYRFGRLTTLPKNKVGLIATGGVAHYFGKKEIVSGSSYHYPSYITIHTYAGIILNAGKKMNLFLAAGPGVGFYNSTTRFQPGLILQGNYYVTESIAIGPAIIFMTEKGTDPLGVFSLKASRAF